MMHYVYIIRCEDGSLYTGYTTDVERRFEAHKKGRGARYTRSRKPVEVVYTACFDNKNDALKEEYRIKHMPRQAKINMIENSKEITHNSSNEYRRNIMIKVLRCKKCKKTLLVLKDHGCPTICCGDEMVELKANITDGALEKHVPAVTVDGNKVIVNVGSVDHPMIDAHYIEFIALETDKGVQVACLNPGEAPHAEFLTADKPVTVYEYCNLHGLWKKDL